MPFAVAVAVAVAAATSVSMTVVIASITLTTQLIRSSGWEAVLWQLLCYNVPGVLIGGQLGSRLQGKIEQRTMRRAIAGLFFILAIAMTGVAIQKMTGGIFKCGG